MARGGTLARVPTAHPPLALSPDGPAAKKAKLDAAPPASEAEAETEVAAAAGDGAAAASDGDTPVTVGYKTFARGADAAKYFYAIINSVTHGQDLNEVGWGERERGRGGKGGGEGETGESEERLGAGARARPFSGVVPPPDSPCVPVPSHSTSSTTSSPC